MAIKWTPDLSVDDEALDSQHQKLLANIEELSQAISNNKGEEMIEGMLDFFISYAKEHFSDEEKYMADHNYPYTTEHIKLHMAFMKSYAEFKDKLDEQGPNKDLMIEIYTFLMKWWLEHIEVEDHKYYIYIQKTLDPRP